MSAKGEVMSSTTVTVETPDGPVAIDSAEGREYAVNTLLGVDLETGELQPELPGMPRRPGPLWDAGASFEPAPVRNIVVSFTGNLALSASEPGHHVLAEVLRTGESVYLQVEGTVAKRGLVARDGDIVGLATLKVFSAVRADEAGVLRLQAELDTLSDLHRMLAQAAVSALDRAADWLPRPPRDTDDSEEAVRIRELHGAVEQARRRALGALP